MARMARPPGSPTGRGVPHVRTPAALLSWSTAATRQPTGSPWRSPHTCPWRLPRVYHRRPPPPHGPPSRNPPLRGPRSSRCRASLTFNVRPATSLPCKPVIAACAARSSAISTKPKPRGRPVSRSVMMLIRSTTPYGANRSRRSCSVTEKAIFPTKIFTGDSFYAVTARGENTVGKVRYCTRNMDPVREETCFDAHPPHLLPLCQGESTGTQEVDMETKTERAGRCRGLYRYRELLDLKVHVRIPALEDGAQFPVERPHAGL